LFFEESGESFRVPIADQSAGVAMADDIQPAADVSWPRTLAAASTFRSAERVVSTSAWSFVGTRYLPASSRGGRGGRSIVARAPREAKNSGQIVGHRGSPFGVAPVVMS
jgi:hypothetical protein